MFNRCRSFLSYAYLRYWLLWFCLGGLFLLAQRPYPALVVFGGWLGRQSMHFLKRRVAIAKRNLIFFPDISSQ
ncbi:hypothetical protein [Pectobacterium versatile]|uniref:LpxL/LpxP family acyltransferase n=1 Tax=Pectobacterium versatile TaxID=2488639 RepID=UPI0038571C02